jgi:PqqD family protein of HPr-rel-A system
MATPTEHTLWAALTPEHAVFNYETGETHLLTALPALVLQTLQAGTQGFDALCCATAALCDVADDAPWRTKVASALAGLAAVELAESIPSAELQ